MKRLVVGIIGLGVASCVLIGIGSTQRAQAPTPTKSTHTEAAPIAKAAPHKSDAFTEMAGPMQLRIPALSIESAVRAVGTTPDGSMAIPDSLTDTGWYDKSSHPGNPGKAVLAAHAGYPHKPTQFRKLHTITPGETIDITDARGQTASFSVIQTARYKPDQAPLHTIFGPSPTARLNIITCIGEWDAVQQTYAERLVVYAARTK